MARYFHHFKSAAQHFDLVTITQGDAELRNRLVLSQGAINRHAVLFQHGVEAANVVWVVMRDKDCNKLKAAALKLGFYRGRVARINHHSLPAPGQQPQIIVLKSRDWRNFECALGVWHVAAHIGSVLEEALGRPEQ